MVVRRGQGDDLADGVAGLDLFAGAAVFGWVVERADTDDGCLALGETWYGVDGSEAARVGQGDRGSGVVFRGELAFAAALDDVFVGFPEGRERHVLGALDVRYNEQTRTVRAWQVDCDTEVDLCVVHCDWLAVFFVVADVHRRVELECSADRVADEVGEGDLAAACTTQVVVDHDAVVDQQLGWDSPDRGCGWNGQ